MALVFARHVLACVVVMTTALLMTSPVAGKRDAFTDVQVKSLGGIETLWCNASADYNANIWNDSIPVSWMLPNLTVLSDTQDRFSVGYGNWTLSVINITKSDLGLYHCMLKTGPNLTSWYLAKIGLNAQGPYFQDMWEEYKWNTIIGLCAGLGFLALAVGAILVYHFRWQPENNPQVAPYSGEEVAEDGDDAEKSRDGETPTGEDADANAGVVSSEGGEKAIPLETMNGQDNKAVTGDDTEN